MPVPSGIISFVNFHEFDDTGCFQPGAAIERKGGAMQVATRIDFARPPTSGLATGILALAVASGIAGFTIAYPEPAPRDGVLDRWTGRLEAKVSKLTAPTISPEMTITAKFHGTALAVKGVFKASAAGLSGISDALAPEISSIAAATATGLAELSLPETRAMPVTGGTQGTARLVPSKSPATGSGYSAGARLSEPASSNVERDLAQPAAPLDAVRIALPRPAPVADKAGALTTDVALERTSVPVSAAPALEPTNGQPLAASAQSEVPSALAPDRLSDAPPFGPLSTSKEVREFDLANLGTTKPEAASLARTSASAIAAIKPTLGGHQQDLSKVAKVPDRVVGDHILHVAGLSLEGMPSGNLVVRIGMGGELSVKLADILTPLRDQMAPETFGPLIDSSAASEYVSFADLRAAGFDVRYDAGNDRLVISAQY